MQDIRLEKISNSQLKKRPAFSVGDKITVFVRLKEGDKERVQAFRGLVISKHPKSGKGATATFTIRKVSEGVGVERIFPLNSPFIDRIEVESSSKIRRSRLYFLRDLVGKKARLKELDRFGSDVVTTAPAVISEEASHAPQSEAGTESETKA